MYNLKVRFSAKMQDLNLVTLTPCCIEISYKKYRLHFFVIHAVNVHKSQANN